MGKKAPLTCQSINADIVIRKNIDISKAKIEAYCKEYCLQYAFIEHKGDIQPTTGEVEGTHYHLVLKYSEGKVAFSTRLNQIVQWFGFKDALGIEIDKIGSLGKCLQYLIHKNNQEKTPHDISEIVHNYDANEFAILMSEVNDQCVTYDWLYQGCMECDYKYQLIKFFSPNVYRAWRNVILDMWEDIHKLSRLS